ncbi:MAG: WhiB family transcriptional regulator [Acidimicrobiia bacterium]
MAVAFTNRSWELEAACRGTRAPLFVPPIGYESKGQQRVRESAAIRICARCPVQAECLDYALRVANPSAFGAASTSNSAANVPARYKAEAAAPSRTKCPVLVGSPTRGRRPFGRCELAARFRGHLGETSWARGRPVR